MRCNAVSKTPSSDSVVDSEEGAVFAEICEVPVEDEGKYSYYLFVSALTDDIA